MRGVSPDQPWLARRRPGQQVAADVTGRKAQRAQATDHQMGKVLTNTAFLFQHFKDRRRYGGRLRIKGEFLENFCHQGLCTEQNRPFGWKAIKRISRQFVLDPDV